MLKIKKTISQQIIDLHAIGKSAKARKIADSYILASKKTN